MVGSSLFRHGTALGGGVHGDALTLVERIWREDDLTLDHEVTITGPNRAAQPGAYRPLWD